MSSTINPILPIMFDTLFRAREDAFGVMRDGGKIECVREPYSAERMRAHLEGRESLAVYPLLDDGTCPWACADFDCKDAPERAREAAEAVRRELSGAGIVSWLERSKSKGYHLWAFFEGKVEAALARALLSAALNAAGVPQGVGKGVLVEVFPKQDRLSSGQVGNCVNLPYFPPDAAEGKRVVLDREGRELGAEEFAARALPARVPRAAVKAAFGVLLEKIEDRRRTANEEDGEAKAGEAKLRSEAIAKIAKIIVPYWKQPNRHYLALGLAGLLAKRGFARQTAEALIKKIVREARDEEAEDRVAAVRSTYRRLEEEKEISGAAHLAERMEPEALRAVMALLKEEKGTEQPPSDEDVRVVDEDGSPAFLAKPPVKGLLKEVCDYFALSTDANLEIRAAAALSLLSLLIGRRAWLQEGRRRTYPNLWVFVVGPSSDTRKSTLQALCRDLWEEVVQDDLVAARMFPERSDYEQIDTGIKDDEKPNGRAAMKDPIWDDDFSPEALAHKLALITAVCKYTVGMVFTDEAALHLEALQKKDYLSGTLGQMLKLYDCPRRTGFERRQGGRRTPYRIENVFVNWFLVTTPQTLAAAATDQIKYSGFFQRCCLVPAGPREREPDDFQPPVPEETTRALVEKLKRLAMAGPAEVRFSEGAKEVYGGFVKELRRFRQENGNLLEAELLARLDTVAKKLSVILELAKRADAGEDLGGGYFFDEEISEVVISREAAEQAVGLAKYFWKATAFVAENWLSTSTFKSERRLVMDVLQREGGQCSKSVLLRKTDLPVKKLDEILATLVARKEVVCITSQPGKKGGRPQKSFSLV